MTAWLGTEAIQPFLRWVIDTSWQASLLAGVVLLLGWLLRGRIPAGWRYALWLLVLVRLLMPVAPPSRISAFNLLPAGPAADVRDAADAREAPAPRAANTGERSTPPAAGKSTGSRPPLAGGPPPAGTKASLPSVAPEAADGNTAVVASAEAAAARPDAAAPAGSVSSAGDEVPDAAGRHESDGARFWATVLAAAAWAYLAVGVVLLVRLAGANLLLFRKTSHLPPCDDETVLRTLDRCRRELHLGRRLRVKVTDMAGGPAVMGVFRPTLLLSADTLRSLSPPQLRFVLLHELAHLKRWDCLVNLLANVLVVLHWPNVLLRFAFSRMRADRELAIDEMVLSVVGRGERRAYGRTILALAGRCQRSGVPPCLVGVIESNREMTRRIAMIANFAPSSRVRSVLAAVLMACVAAVTLTGADRSRPAAPAEPDAPAAAAAKAAASKATAKKPEQQVREKLDSLIKRPSFHDIALKDLIEYFREVSGINTSVNWRALAAAGVEPETKVSVDLRNVTSRRFLRIVLDQLSGSTGSAIDFAIRDGAVRISTTADLRRTVDRRAYDVRDLLAAGGKSAKPTEAKSGATSDVLLRLIRAQCDRASWQDGGGRGAITLLGGRFVVTQDFRNHETIRELLAELRVNLGLSKPTPAARAAAERQKRALERLAREVERMSFRDVRLSQVLQFLQEYSDVSFAVNWAALQRGGVERSTKLTLASRHIPTGKALRTILEELVPGTDAPRLGYEVVDGVVVISTADDLARRLHREVYDIRDLADKGQDVDAVAEAVVKMILDHTGKAAWVGHGGSGRIGHVLGQVVVAQSYEGHQAVRQLLEMIRAGDRKIEAPAKAAPTLGPRGKAPAGMAPAGKLRERLSLRLDRAALGDVVKILSERVDLPVVLDGRASARTPVTANLDNVPLAEGLERIARSAGLACCVTDQAVYLFPSAATPPDREEMLLEVRKAEIAVRRREVELERLATAGKALRDETAAAKTQLARAEALYKRGGTSAAELSTARLAVTRAEAAVCDNDAEVRLKQLDLEEARLVLDSLQRRSKKLRPAGRPAAPADREQLLLDLETNKIEIRKKEVEIQRLQDAAKALREDLAAAEKQLKGTKLRVEDGVVSRAELAKAEAAVRKAKAAVQDATAKRQMKVLEYEALRVLHDSLQRRIQKAKAREKTTAAP